MIRRRDPGHFDNLVGPIILSIALFFAVLANFIIRGAYLTLGAKNHSDLTNF